VATAATAAAAYGWFERGAGTESPGELVNYLRGQWTGGGKEGEMDGGTEGMVKNGVGAGGKTGREGRGGGRENVPAGKKHTRADWEKKKVSRKVVKEGEREGGEENKKMCQLERSKHVRTGKRRERPRERYSYRIARWFSGRAASKRSSRSQTHILFFRP